ncbi:MAG: ferric reductase-like transmembrane domain-containing protein [Solirubrobacterales bacterium]
MISLAVIDPGEHVFWIASRASGIVAIALMTFSVAVGLMSGGRLLNRFGRNVRARTGTEQRDLTRMHEYTSLAAMLAIAVHALTLLGDGYLQPTFTELVVPLMIDFRPIYTGLGIVGGYAVVILGLSYYARDRIGAARWKRLHRFVIVGWLLSVVHILGAGTDASTAWLRLPLLTACAVIAVLFVLRISSARSVLSKPARAGGVTATSGR